MPDGLPVSALNPIDQMALTDQVFDKFRDSADPQARAMLSRELGRLVYATGDPELEAILERDDQAEIADTLRLLVLGSISRRIL